MHIKHKTKKLFRTIASNIFIVFFALVVVMAIVGYVLAFNECLADGYKLYECRAMMGGPYYYHLDANQP